MHHKTLQNICSYFPAAPATSYAAEYLHYRNLVEGELNQRFKFTINGSPEQVEALASAREEIACELQGCIDLIDKLVPNNYAGGL